MSKFSVVPDTSFFSPGDRVRYIPAHAYGDSHHPDCENGVVSSCNEHVVFVRYYAKVNGRESSGLKETAQATNPEDLIKT